MLVKGTVTVESAAVATSNYANQKMYYSKIVHHLLTAKAE